jgi:hypothetical protein
MSWRVLGFARRNGDVLSILLLDGSKGPLNLSSLRKGLLLQLGVVVVEFDFHHLFRVGVVVRNMFGEAAKGSVLFNHSRSSWVGDKVARGNDDGSVFVLVVFLALDEVGLVFEVRVVAIFRHIKGQPESTFVTSLEMFVLMLGAQDFGGRGLEEIA